MRALASSHLSAARGGVSIRRHTAAASATTMSTTPTSTTKSLAAARFPPLLLRQTHHHSHALRCPPCAAGAPSQPGRKRGPGEEGSEAEALRAAAESSVDAPAKKSDESPSASSSSEAAASGSDSDAAAAAEAAAREQQVSCSSSRGAENEFREGQKERRYSKGRRHLNSSVGGSFFSSNLNLFFNLRHPNKTKQNKTRPPPPRPPRAQPPPARTPPAEASPPPTWTGSGSREQPRKRELLLRHPAPQGSALAGAASSATF